MYFDHSLIHIILSVSNKLVTVMLMYPVVSNKLVTVMYPFLHAGDPDMVSLWTRFRELSLNEYAKMYQV